MIRVIRIFLVLSVAGCFVTHAAPDWYSLGLNDRAVNCILADDTSAILAGTDSGVSVRWNKTWYHIKMLPVKALARVSSTAVAAAAGNGTKSADGIYIGRNIINGPPFYSFTFSLSNYMTLPTALAMLPIYTTTHAPGPNGVLYAANGNSVMSGLVTNDSLKKLDKIGIPAWAFGVESPFCSSLYPFSGRVYAGGYDKSPVPGQSFLLSGSGNLTIDTLYAMRAMKTTAIAQGRFSSILGSSTSTMVIADVDSGVFFYDLSWGNPWRRINGPLGAPGSTNAFVRSLFVRQVSGSASDNVLYAANKDGVFQYTAFELQAFWVKLGALPAQPNYITGVGARGDLLAATNSGIYRYGDQGTGVTRATKSLAGTNNFGKKSLNVSVKPSLQTGKVGFNIQGRSIVSKALVGANASGAVVTDVH